MQQYSITSHAPQRISKTDSPLSPFRRAAMQPKIYISAPHTFLYTVPSQGGEAIVRTFPCGQEN